MSPTKLISTTKYVEETGFLRMILHGQTKPVNLLKFTILMILLFLGSPPPQPAVFLAVKQRRKGEPY